jgi:hypothetical protein
MSCHCLWEGPHGRWDCNSLGLWEMERTHSKNKRQNKEKDPVLFCFFLYLFYNNSLMKTNSWLHENCINSFSGKPHHDFSKDFLIGPISSGSHHCNVIILIQASSTWILVGEKTHRNHIRFFFFYLKCFYSTKISRTYTLCWTFPRHPEYVKGYKNIDK